MVNCFDLSPAVRGRRPAPAAPVARRSPTGPAGSPARRCERPAQPWPSSGSAGPTSGVVPVWWRQLSACLGAAGGDDTLDHAGTQDESPTGLFPEAGAVDRDLVCGGLEGDRMEAEGLADRDTPCGGLRAGAVEGGELENACVEANGLGGRLWDGWHSGVDGSSKNLLDFPDHLLELMLRDVQWEARTTCRNFCAIIEHTAVRLRIDAAAASGAAIAVPATRRRCWWQWLRRPAGSAGGGGGVPPLDNAAAAAAQLPRMLSRLPNLKHLHMVRGSVIPDMRAVATPSIASTPGPNPGNGSSSASTALVTTTTTTATTTATSTATSSSAAALTCFNLTNGGDLQNLSGLLGWSATLTVVGLYHCRQLTDLHPLASCALLSNLILDCVEHLSDLSPLGACPALRSLAVHGAGDLTDLTPLATCAALESVLLKGCGHLTSIRPLAACGALRRLTVIGSAQMRGFGELVECTALSAMWLQGVDAAREECAALSEARPQLRITHS